MNNKVTVTMTTEEDGSIIMQWHSPYEINDELLFDANELIEDEVARKVLLDSIDMCPHSIHLARDIMIRDYQCRASAFSDDARAIFERLAMLELQDLGWTSEELYNAFNTK